jgi:hypothetical protein
VIDADDPVAAYTLAPIGEAINTCENSLPAKPKKTPVKLPPRDARPDPPACREAYPSSSRSRWHGSIAEASAADTPNEK